MRKQDHSMKCPKCGGVHFQETEFKQYRKGTSSANVGGELFAVIEHGPQVRVCLCGHPMPMVTRAVEQKHRDSFAASIEKALAYRTKLDPDWLEAAMLQIYASKQDAAELNRKLARLLEIVCRPDYLDSPSPANSKAKQKNRAPAARKTGGDHTISRPKRGQP